MLQVFSTEDLIAISGLDKNAVDHLRRNNLLLQASKKPVRWSYYNVLLARFVATVQGLLTGHKTITLLKEMLLNQRSILRDPDEPLKYLFSKPFLVFAFLDVGLYCYAMDFDYLEEFGLTNLLLSEKRNIIKVPEASIRMPPELRPPGFTTLVIPNAYIVNIARLKAEVEDCINAIDEAIEQGLARQLNSSNTSELGSPILAK